MHSRYTIAGLLLIGAASPSFAVSPIALDEVATGLVSPLTLAEPADGTGRLFIVDQPGQIWIVMPDGTMLDQPFLDELDPGYDERGLLGLAFDPDYATNGTFYVSYSAPLRDEAPDEWNHTNNVSAFVASSDPDVADADSENILLQIDQPQGNHNVSTLLFGGDGYLYVGVGDGGGADDSGDGHVEDWYPTNDGGNGQDVTSNLLGSILRIDVDSESYQIPEDNPFMGREGLDEIYAFGFRNPYRFSWDEEWGLIVGDVGQALWEEIDLVTSGGNYGWNVKEGFSCFNAADNESPLADCPSVDNEGNPLIDPVYVYPHEGKGNDVRGFAIVGGHVYRGSDVPYLRGQYIFGDWSHDFTTPEGTLLAARPVDGMWNASVIRIVHREGNKLGQFLLGISEDQSGELYVLAKDEFGPSGATGVVYRIAPQQIAIDLAGMGTPGLRVPSIHSTDAALRFETVADGKVSLAVFDAAGRNRRSLLDERVSDGAHELTWDGRDESGQPLPTGVYFYRLTTGTAENSARFVILR